MTVGTANRPALVTVDVGGTLAVPEGPGITAALSAISPLPADHAAMIIRERVHTAPALTGPAIHEICRALAITADAFPRDLPAPRLRLLPLARAALREISACLPVVTLSNVASTEANLDQLAALLSPYVTDHFPSCRTGYAKPDRRAFEAVAAHYRIEPGQLVHIGDNWECDVLGATRAGAYAIWIAGGRPVPGGSAPGRYGLDAVPDLAGAAARVRELIGN